MAPQQNSTLIEDDFLGSSQFRKLPNNLPKQLLRQNSADIVDEINVIENNDDEEEIIKRYSPILPPVNDHTSAFVSKQLRSYVTNNCWKHIDDENFKAGSPCTKTSLQQYKNHNKYHNGHNRNFTNNRRCRSISLQGDNTAMEHGSKEIPIWIGSEPRYVSGVTNKTTCNDIIKALIDDEIQNGNYAYIDQKNKSNNINNIQKHQLNNDKQTNERNEHGGTIIHQDGCKSVGATSRDCAIYHNDLNIKQYVITESWRGIERSYDGNMTILPVWKAWSRVHNEIRLTLRHRGNLNEPVQAMAPPITQETHKNFLRKFLKKLTCLWRKDKENNKPAPKSKSTLKAKENCLLLSKKDAIPEEFLFVILPDKHYEHESGNEPNLSQNKRRFQTPKKHRGGQRRKLKTSKLKKYAPSRKQQTTNKNHKIFDSRNCKGQAREVPAKTVRSKLAQKTTEMDDKLTKEYFLTCRLNEKCKLYQQQNQIYSNPEQQWDMSIGQVQRKIENYAQEIVRTEHELLELKAEIRQDISLINKLKRATLERQLVQKQQRENAKTSAKPANEKSSVDSIIEIKSTVDDTLEILNYHKTMAWKTPEEQMQFVDNIYEFCDNNASMLV